MEMAGVLSLLALLVPVSAVSLNYTLGIATTGGFADNLVLCNSSFDAANATGIFSYTPSFNSNARFGAALALAQNQRINSTGYGLQASLMYNPGSQDYLNNSKTGFDACAFAFNIAAMKYNTWLRAQSDNGSCLTAMDSTCVNDLTTMANSYASQLNTPSTESAGSLPDVCQQILLKISSSTPDSCKGYIEAGNSLLAGKAELTQSVAVSGTSALTKSCQIHQNGSTWYNINSQIASYSESSYDLASVLVWPIMTIFMPPADSKVKSSISAPETVLSCLHINHYNNGSRVAPFAGTPTPVLASSTPSASPGISGGAIAGIVIAVLLLALAGVGVWLFRRRKRREQHQQLLEPEAVEVYSAHPKMDRKYSELSGHALSELSPETHQSELPAHHRAELAGHHGAEMPGHFHYEMDAGHQYHELPGTIPDAKIR